MNKAAQSRKAPRLCLCGRPSLGGGENTSIGGGFYRGACARCAEIESRLHARGSKRTGSDRLSEGLRRTRGQGDTFDDVKRAAHRWLKARGLDTQVSITFVEGVFCDESLSA